MMTYNINYIRKLCTIKEKNLTDKEDIEKIGTLKILLENDNVFFMLDAETAVGILLYLGVPEEKIKGVYFELIKPEAYIKYNDPYISIGEK